ncbi:MAG: hypothetical protein O3A51_10225 [Verrucomicrobia bacterium]|nr:hypothetical protein [Verrucomicrobiota bacterium]
MKLRRTMLGITIFMTPVAGMAQYDIGAAMKQAEQYQKQYGAGQQTTVAELPDIIELKEKDVTGFIKTVPQLKALGLKFDNKNTKQGPAQTMEAIKANSAAMAILRKNGFTTDSLSQVAFSIAMAMASLNMDKDAIANAKAQSAQAMESVRGQMTEQQFAFMQQQMGASMKMVDQVEEQPKGNVDLVTKHRKALEASFAK